MHLKPNKKGDGWTSNIYHHRYKLTETEREPRIHKHAIINKIVALQCITC